MNYLSDRFKKFINYNFSEYQCCRKFVGGRWELWYIDYPVCSELWFCKKELDSYYYQRPGLSRGKIIKVEDYNWKKI